MAQHHERRSEVTATGSDYRGPLSEVRVLEFCQVAAGPFCGMLFADMGADVIKIESRTGDSMRQWPPFREGYSENFASLNRSKRSIALNLKDPADVEVALELVRTADILIENNRPGVMKRLGLDYESLSALRPQLVYCSISAYGQSGPRASEGGFDLTIQGVAGVMGVTGEPGRPPVKCGVPISDFSAGLYAAYSALAMVIEARQTGRGTHVDVPMMGTTLGVSALQTSQYFGTGVDPEPLGSAHPRNAPYQAFAAADGYFVMAAGNDKLWTSVCEIIERPDLLRDPRFTKQFDRATHQVELKEILEQEFIKESVAVWVKRLGEAGVPSGPINSVSQALADPQVEHAGWVVPISLPGGGQTQTFGPPVTLSDRPKMTLRQPPALDEHGDEIRASLQ
ncbi:MAG TPA: CoA transferase [Modicisalibacter sp.]|nr:CoA transferase [Modicisalibacter sp.]